MQNEKSILQMKPSAAEIAKSGVDETKKERKKARGRRIFQI